MPNSIFTEYATTVARIQTGMGRSQAFSLSGTISLKAGFLGLGSPCLMCWSHCPFIVMMGWIIVCRRSLKGPNGIVWASFFAHHMAATASVCDCSMCSKQDDIVCHTSSVNVPGGNLWKMSSSSTFGMLPGKSSSELSVDNSLGCRNFHRGSRTVFSTVLVIFVTLHGSSTHSHDPGWGLWHLSGSLCTSLVNGHLTSLHWGMFLPQSGELSDVSVTQQLMCFLQPCLLTD